MTDFIANARKPGAFGAPPALQPMMKTATTLPIETGSGPAGANAARGIGQLPLPPGVQPRNFTPPAAENTTGPGANARPQDTIQMFSRLNPTVQQQVLVSMGLTPEQAQAMVTTIGAHPELQADNPNIVAAWQQLFGTSGVDVHRLGTTIFSDSVHPEDADHNYHNYGAIEFVPGQGLVATAASGQYGEPNHRGLRQLERPAEIAAALVAAYFGFPELLAALGPEATMGAEAFAGATATAEGAAGALGAESLIPEIVAPTIPDLAAVPEITAPGALADAFNPAINSAIDTSLIPSMTAPAIPDLGGLPAITGDPFAGAVADGSGATSAGGIGDRLLNGLTADPLRTLGAGVGVASLLGNHPSQVPSGLRDAVNANTPLANDARNVLTNHGAPTADQRTAIDSSIDQQLRQGTEAIVQASINAGQGGKDSMVTQDKIRAFKGQLETMRQELYMKQAEQNVLNALQELGLVTNEQFALAQLELQQNTAAQQRSMSIMQSLGWLFGMSGPGKNSTPPAG